MGVAAVFAMTGGCSSDQLGTAGTTRPGSTPGSATNAENAAVGSASPTVATSATASGGSDGGDVVCDMLSDEQVATVIGVTPQGKDAELQPTVFCNWNGFVDGRVVDGVPFLTLEIEPAPGFPNDDAKSNDLYLIENGTAHLVDGIGDYAVFESPFHVAPAEVLEFYIHDLDVVLLAGGGLTGTETAMTALAKDLASKL